MNYSYVLLSDRDGNFYIGSTGDLRARLLKHNSGAVRSTAYRRPLRLIYYVRGLVGSTAVLAVAVVAGCIGMHPRFPGRHRFAK
jgi:predicted GIY-YIG superfamily endonuclease